MMTPCRWLHRQEKSDWREGMELKSQMTVTMTGYLGNQYPNEQEEACTKQ